VLSPQSCRFSVIVPDSLSKNLSGYVDRQRMVSLTDRNPQADQSTVPHSDQPEPWYFVHTGSTVTFSIRIGSVIRASPVLCVVVFLSFQFLSTLCLQTLQSIAYPTPQSHSNHILHNVRHRQVRPKLHQECHCHHW